MKLFIITLLSLICFHSNAVPTSAGPWTSGGGNALVYPDGTLRFLDITPKNEYPTTVPSEATLEKIYAGPRHLKKMYDNFDDFHAMFADAISEWRQFSPALFDDMLYKLESVKAYFVLFNTYKAIIKHNNATLAVYSPSAPQNVQVLAALYEVSHISFDKRVYDKLASDQDRLAVVVHEGLRQYFYLLNQDWRMISTGELEEAVNIFITQKPSQVAFNRLETVIKHKSINYSNLVRNGKQIIEQLAQLSQLTNEEIKKLVAMITTFNQKMSVVTKFNDYISWELLETTAKVFIKFDTEYESIHKSIGRNNPTQRSQIIAARDGSRDLFWFATAKMVTAGDNPVNQLQVQFSQGLTPISEVILKPGYCFNADKLIEIVRCDF